MKITVKQEEGFTWFAEVIIGHVFLFNENWYIKTTESEAVLLQNGKPCVFPPKKAIDKVGRIEELIIVELDK